jgi:hypothetical protein
MLDGLKKPKSKGKKKAMEADPDVEIVESKPNSTAGSNEQKENVAHSADDVDMVNGDGSPAPPTAASAVASTSKLSDSDDLPDPSTLLRPSPSPAPMKIISNSSIVCEHGLLDPKKAESMKRVSEKGMLALRELGVEIEPELMASRDFCRECVAGIAAGSSSFSFFFSFFTCVADDTAHFQSFCTISNI